MSKWQKFKLWLVYPGALIGATVFGVIAWIGTVIFAYYMLKLIFY